MTIPTSLEVCRIIKSKLCKIHTKMLNRKKLAGIYIYILHKSNTLYPYTQGHQVIVLTTSTLRHCLAKLWLLVLHKTKHWKIRVEGYQILGNNVNINVSEYFNSHIMQWMLILRRIIEYYDHNSNWSKSIILTISSYLCH